MKRFISQAAVILVLFGAALTMSAEHKLGKEITGKIVDQSGKKISADLSKKKHIILYYTASW